jgi:O-antigen/teichoic acid export membrane protein
MFVARSPVTFFAVQAAVTLAEAMANRVILYREMPHARRGRRLGWRLLWREARFAAGIALSSAVGAMINQADKLALSHTMLLGEFGLFSLVVSICAGIAMVVPPFVQAFQPRLTSLLAQDRRAEFAHVYRLSVALGLALAFALAGTIAAQPEMVLFAWTGHRDLAEHLAPILSLYAIGAGISSFLFVPAVLQYALGYIRLHVIGYLLFGAIIVPAVVWAAYAFGPIGTGAVWTAGNLLFVLLWTPFVHRRLLTLQERRGLELGALWRGLVLGGALAITRLLDFSRLDRLGALFFLAIISGLIIVLGIALSRELRGSLRELANDLRTGLTPQMDH